METITIDKLKSRGQDYLLAHWEGEELVMEPFCSCGALLEEDYHCSRCNRDCMCTFIACNDSQSFSIVQKLIFGNPNFREFTASMVEE